MVKRRFRPIQFEDVETLRNSLTEEGYPYQSGQDPSSQQSPILLAAKNGMEQVTRQVLLLRRRHRPALSGGNTVSWRT
jgi:hypothetical protein